MSAPTVSVGKPRRIGSAMGYALHGVIVTVRNASAEQLAACSALAASFAGTQVDALRPGRYLVRQAPPESGKSWRMAGDADREAVEGKAARVAGCLRTALTQKAPS